MRPGSEPFGSLRGAAGLPRLPGPRHVKRAGVNDAEGVVEEAVEVDGSVLVPFRHKDVRQPIPAHMVVKPTIERLGDLPHVVPVYLRLVERQRHEVRKSV